MNVDPILKGQPFSDWFTKNPRLSSIAAAWTAIVAGCVLFVGYTLLIQTQRIEIHRTQTQLLREKLKLGQDLLFQYMIQQQGRLTSQTKSMDDLLSRLAIACKDDAHTREIGLALTALLREPEAALQKAPQGRRFIQLFEEYTETISKQESQMELSFQKELRSLKIRFSLGVLFVLGLVLLPLFVLFRTVIPALRSLVEGARILERGDLSHRITEQSVNTTLETYLVARSINNTAARLSELQRSTLEMGQVKSDFVATVSHELRTPLTAIRGAVGLLSSGAAGDMPSSSIPLLEITTRNTDRLIRLIADILDISKIESGSLRLSLTKQDLRPLIQKALEDLRPVAQAKEVQLQFRGPGFPLFCLVDEDRFQQIITNLVSNAIKYSPKDGAVWIDLRPSPDASSPTDAIVSVRDEGEGIALENQSKLFQKFSQIQDISHKNREGTGLGLAICKALVEEMGGKISVESSLGSGATFYVNLPCTQEATNPSLRLDR